MKRTAALLASTLAVTVALSTPVAAGVKKIEGEAKDTITTEAAPLDMAVSSDGKWSFILTEGGKINIYDEDGKFKDIITVDKNADKIVAIGDGDKLLVSSWKTKKVQEVELDFIYDINIAGSPFLGKADAPVPLVVFSDFQ